MRFKHIALLTSGLFTALNITVQASEIRVALLGSTTGPLVEFSPPLISASETAFTQINQQGGIGNGLQIASVMLDTACDNQKALKAITQAVNDEKAIGIVGPQCSGALLAASKEINKLGVLTVTTSTVAPSIAALNDGDLIFRTALNAQDQADYLASALKDLYIDEVIVTYMDNAFGQDVSKTFAKSYKTVGGKVINYEGGAGDMDFDSSGDYHPPKRNYALFNVKDGDFVVMKRQF